MMVRCATVYAVRADFYFNFFSEQALCIFSLSALHFFFFCYIFRLRWRLSCCVSLGQSVVELKLMAAHLTGAEKSGQNSGGTCPDPLPDPLADLLPSFVSATVRLLQCRPVRRAHNFCYL